jgi:hypothetical protein
MIQIHSTTKNLPAQVAGFSVHSNRKPRLRGMDKLKNLIAAQNKLTNNHKFEVIQFKDIPSKFKTVKRP